MRFRRERGRRRAFCTLRVIVHSRRFRLIESGVPRVLCVQEGFPYVFGAFFAFFAFIAFIAFTAFMLRAEAVVGFTAFIAFIVFIAVS